MNKAFTVARWEYVEKVKNKWFLIGLFVTPMMMIGMGVLPTYLASQGDQDTRVIGLIDATGVLARPLAERLEQRYPLPDGRPNYVVRLLTSSRTVDLDKELADANRLLANGAIEGFAVLRGDTPADSVVEYRAISIGDFRIGSRIEETMRGIIAERRAEALGLSSSIVEALDAHIAVKTVKVSKEGKAEGAGFDKVFFSSLVFVMMLFFLIVTSGQLLVRSVIEEKANRIVEVLVSSCSPGQLMTGKVLGLSALGFTQIGFWSLMAIAASAQLHTAIIDPRQALLLIIYFIFGYLFYAALLIAAGSPLNTEQEAQQVNSYIMMLLVVPIVVMISVIKDPGAPWIRVLTYVPLFTPSMMALRIPIQMPSVVEILTTILVMAVSTYVAMVAAGRIFKIGILATGKSPRFSEIIRWAKGA